MDSRELMLLIDSMELNEEFVDNHLVKIMTRNTVTNRHMENALRFLKYKLAVNKEETISCSNEREYEFVSKLVRVLNAENIELVCQITNIVLQLDPKTITSKAEHLLQQILNEIELPPIQIIYDVCEDDTPKALLDLKLTSCILEAVIEQKAKVALPFLMVPLENMVFSPNKNILNFFYTNTIQHFKTAVCGYSILDRLWACLKRANDFRLVTLKALSCLSDFYLPIAGEAEKQNDVCSVAADSEFWETVLFGLQSNENSVRKMAVYLIKRALESLSGSQKNININTPDMVMVWDQKNEKLLKSMWDDFFVLLETLEEMQSNIVLPSLKLFESVKHLGHCWMSCAYNIGLKHDNALVRLNCIKYRLELKVESKAEALPLLNALNDINLYENPVDSRKLTTNVSKALEDKNSMLNILEAFPSVKWIPVPLYYLTETLGEVIYPSLLLNVEHKKICSYINDILRIPCNSPVIRKAVFANVANIIVNSCKGFTWDDYSQIYPNFHVETPISSYLMTALAAHIKKNLYLTDTDKNGFAEAMAYSCENINIGLLYVSGHEQDGIPYFLNIINEKVDKIQDICNRQNANRAQCLAEVSFLFKLYSNTVGRSEPYMVFINGAVMKHHEIILQYLSSLLNNTLSTDVDSLIIFYDSLNDMPITDVSAKDTLLELYKTCVLLLNNSGSPLDKKTTAMSIMNYMLLNNLMSQQQPNELLKLKEFLVIVKDIGKDMGKQGSGKLKNYLYEKSCEIVLSHLKEPNAQDVIEVFGFVEDILECGGYGCLKFILRIFNRILPKLINNESVTFDLSLFLNQMWMQVCELKTNKEYMVCVDDFVKLITQDSFLRHPQHNSVVTGYFTTIIDMAPTKHLPLYFLVKHLSNRNVMMYDNMVRVLCDILLYAVVPRKDMRITENLSVDLFPKMQGLMVADMSVYSQHIQFLSITLVARVTGVSQLNEISDHIMCEVDELLKAKPRYYHNNAVHRKLFRAMQLLLFIFLKTRQIDAKKTAFWCMNLLKISHDNIIKICIHWYIALYIYSSDITIDDDLLSCLTQNGVPVTSQFHILYYVMRHRIPARVYSIPETEFVLDFLLKNTMGSLFTVRLTAQYFAMKLLETGTIQRNINTARYECFINVLSKTLGELVASNDNSFNTLRSDYFTQNFDIVGDLTIMFIFHRLERRFNMCNENIDSAFAKKTFDQIDEILSTGDHDSFFLEWKGVNRWHSFNHYQGMPPPGQKEADDESKTLQKKYTPSRNMELELENYRQKCESVSDVIVVASLVSRAPNLGGLARSCEVLGARALVIDNLSVLRDKQFQSLSVSAERWLHIEEVRTGRPLKEYLSRQKKEGYCIVAAEQTSASRRLTEFTFPKNTVLVLGHEKEGIPPNLLPLMDHCVEVPQTGIIRSLNVHVTGSIFIWEYIRQHAGGAPTACGN